MAHDPSCNHQEFWMEGSIGMLYSPQQISSQNFPSFGRDERGNDGSRDKVCAHIRTTRGPILILIHFPSRIHIRARFASSTELITRIAKHVKDEVVIERSLTSIPILVCLSLGGDPFPAYHQACPAVQMLFYVLINFFQVIVRLHFV